VDPDEGGRLRLVVSVLYLLFRRALAVAALRLRSREFKELEIVPKQAIAQASAVS
jgi:hypothetical protein